MKKQEYVSPEMEVVEIEMSKALLVGSDPNGSGDKSDGGNRDLPGWD